MTNSIEKVQIIIMKQVYYNYLKRCRNKILIVFVSHHIERRANFDLFKKKFTVSIVHINVCIEIGCKCSTNYKEIRYVMVLKQI
ncbi:GSCOCG00011084001-RA-CDS [Cotesia congregata]|nr:GSCOCG00011084001-RA-CDS [Cotesia congregata]